MHSQQDLERVKKLKGKKARMKGSTKNKAFTITKVTPLFMILDMDGKEFKIQHGVFEEKWIVTR